MSVDNRTEINDCDDEATTFSTTGSSANQETSTTVGEYFEGTGAVGYQHSNVFDDTWTTTDSAGVNLNINMSDVTVYILSQNILIDTYANLGLMIVVGDGTDRIGYQTGGNDATGVPLSSYYSCFKLDINEAAANPGTSGVGHNPFAGTEANLDQTAISQVGVGTLHLAKAKGNANARLDRMTYMANGSYALTINGGTIGTPETMADVQGDDETNGWGMVSNPFGKQYLFVAPTEWGNSAATADTYFTATDEQWYWIGDNGGGRAVGATHFPMRIVGNGTDTTDITWTNLVIVNTGTRSEFTVGDANTDIDWDNVTLDGAGTITHTSAAVSRTFDTVTYNNCDQVAPNGCNGSKWTFNGGFNADGAMLLDTAGDSNDLVGVNFIGDGTGHAIEITATGTYDFDNFTFSTEYTGTGTNAAVWNNSGGAITINVQNGGDTPSVRGGSTTINNAVTITINGVAEGTAATMIANETLGTVTKGDVLLEGIADSTGTVTDTGFNYEAAFGAGIDVLVRARNQGLAQAAVADDGGVLTDETAESNSPTTADMTLTPTTPAVGDAYYFGHNEEFPQLKVWVTTAAANQTITWEYWNGAWTALSGVVDGTSSFTTLGDNIVSWTAPSDWADTTINSQGPYRYVRARVSAIGGGPTGALGRQCQLDVTRYLPIPASGVLVRTITSNGLTATLSQAVDSISRPFG